MNTESIKSQLRSKSTHTVLATLAITFIIVVAFWSGMQVGFNKAAFSYKFGDNYYGTFGPGSGHHGPGVLSDDMSPSHGVSGKIVSLNLPTFVVADDDNVEKVVRINPDTVIRKLRTTITPDILQAGDFVVTIGSPNDKTEVSAKFIRVLPPPPIVPIDTIQQ
ncbi:MAG: hypothetical protein WCG55_00700 [bacterium]